MAKAHSCAARRELEVWVMQVVTLCDEVLALDPSNTKERGEYLDFRRESG